MRITKRDRFEKRLQTWVWGFSRRWPEWARKRHCSSCKDYVLDESMWRFRFCDEHGSWWVYLCLTCAPTRESALQFWSCHEKGS